MEKAAVAVLIHYRARSRMADAAARELSALIATVLAEEKACISIDLRRDVQDPERLMLYELWVDKESYQGDHMRTPHILAFIRRAGEFFTGPPEISFWEPVSSRG